MYDPLVDAATQASQPYPESYWQKHTGQPLQLPAIKGSHSCDVVILGAGFTGLSCARHLQQYPGLNCIVLDANQPGWGCSGRNAGFILPGSGRLDYSAIAQKYGDAAAHATINEYYQALDTIADLIAYAESDCTRVTGGYLKIGHSEKAFMQLRNGLNNLPEQWRNQYDVVSASTINNAFIPEYPNYGGVYRAAGQGINPLQLALDLCTTIYAEQSNIHANSPVQKIVKQPKGYQIITPEAEIHCKQLVLSSNAYSLTSLLPGITEKQFPVLSSVLVTEALSQEQLQGWQPHLMAMDTRSLKYYFRLLPDNRILFGGRGAVTGKNADTANSQQKLKQAFDLYFPTLTQLQTEYFWSGWVSVSADNLPHVTQSEQYPGVYYATGYCGSGLAFSCHAGKRLAEKISGTEKATASPVFSTEIPSFPLARFRRLGLHLYYARHRAFM